MGDRGEVLLGSRGELKLKCIATEIYTMLSQDLLPCTARRRQLGVRWLRWLPHSVTGTCAAEFAVPVVCIHSHNLWRLCRSIILKASPRGGAKSRKLTATQSSHVRPSFSAPRLRFFSPSFNRSPGTEALSVLQLMRGPGW